MSILAIYQKKFYVFTCEKLLLHNIRIVQFCIEEYNANTKMYTNESQRYMHKILLIEIEYHAVCQSCEWVWCEIINTDSAKLYWNTFASF